MTCVACKFWKKKNILEIHNKNKQKDNIRSSKTFQNAL